MPGRKKDYDVSRTVVINASREEVFNFVRKLRNQPHWNPWFRRDPEAIKKYKGEDGKLGSSFYWKGNSKAGEGIQRIVKAKFGRVLETRILFIKPIKVHALTYIGVKELEEEKTKMVWGVRGHLAFPLTIISLLYPPEKNSGEQPGKRTQESQAYPGGEQPVILSFLKNLIFFIAIADRIKDLEVVRRFHEIL